MRLVSSVSDFCGSHPCARKKRKDEARGVCFSHLPTVIARISGGCCRSVAEPAEGFVDQALVALKRAIHAEGFNPGMIEASARIDRLQCTEKYVDKRLGRDLVRYPRSALPIEEAGNAIRGWQGNNGESAGGGLEEGVGQPFMA